MNIGYARTSTVDQKSGFDTQLEDLQSLSCEKIFCEQVSCVAVRAELQAAINFAREGDVLVVTRLDRLVRSVSELMIITQSLAQKKVGLRILNLGIDTQTPTGKLILTVLGGIAQFEREIMLERQREGVYKAKAAGKYKGRKPIALERQQEVIRLVENGMSKAKVAKQIGIGEATVYRILKTTIKNL